MQITSQGVRQRTRLGTSDGDVVVRVDLMAPLPTAVCTFGYQR